MSHKTDLLDKGTLGGPCQDAPNTHHFRTYRGTSYAVVEVTDVDSVLHRFHVPLQVVAAITSPFNQRDIDRNKENAALKLRIEAYREALRRVKVEADSLQEKHCTCACRAMGACSYCEITHVVDEALQGDST